jgi:cytochrome c oxidase accessory protein FixG
VSIEVKQHTKATPISTEERFEPVEWGEQSMFSARKKVFPKRVTGFFRTMKWRFMAVLLGIYYLLPWLRWDRGPFAPDQAVLFDLVTKRFYFFGIEIWPQEIYYLVGILIGAAFGLFFVTSLIGRAWCALGCPQTVWTDLYMLVERFVEGDRNKRIKMDKGPWTLEKIRKRVLKHFIWILIALGTGGAWTFYFMDAPTLAAGLLTLDAPSAAWITIFILTLMTYVMAGFAREQVCTYVCPYSRFQAAMIDKSTFIVTYKGDRGEPRLKHKKGDPWEGRGHCIDCTQCVAVCPMGIDIRKGMQIECINCGLCADACDNVMEQVGLPKSLIGYDSLENVEAREKDEPEIPFSMLQPRTFVYSSALILVGGFMFGALLTQPVVGLNVIHARNPVYVKLSNGDIRNGYTIKVLNKIHDYSTFRLSVTGIKGITMIKAGVDAKAVEFLDIDVPPNEVEQVRIFIRVPLSQVKFESQNVIFHVIEMGGIHHTYATTNFRGPDK